MRRILEKPRKALLCPIVLILLFFFDPLLSERVVFTYEAQRIDINTATLRAFKEAEKIFLQGQEKFLQGKDEQAQQDFKECLEIFPQYAGAEYNLAKIYFSKGNYQEALMLIQAAKDHYPTQIKVLKNMDLLFQEERESLEKALSLLSSQQASIKMSTEEYQQKIEALEEEIGLWNFRFMSPLTYPSQVPVAYFFLHAQISHELDDEEEAFTQYMETIQRDPTQVSAYNYVIKKLLDEGLFPETLYYLSQIEVNQAHIAPKLKEKVLDIPENILREKIARIQAVEKVSPKFLKISEEDYQRYKSAQIFFQTAVPLYIKGQYSQAGVELRKCLETFPQYSQASYYLSKILFEQKKFQLALTYIQKAKDNFPYIFNFQYSAQIHAAGSLKEKKSRLQARLMRLKEDLEAAQSGESRLKREIRSLEDEINHIDLQLITPSLSQEPMPADYFCHHGNVLLELQRYQEAREQLFRTLEESPGFDDVYLGLVKLNFLTGNLKDALYFYYLGRLLGAEIDSDFFSKILDAADKDRIRRIRQKFNSFFSVKPGKKEKVQRQIKLKEDIRRMFMSAKQHFDQGRRFYLKGKRRQAEMEFTECVELFPRYSDAWFYLAEIYLYTQKYEQALNCILKAKSHFGHRLDVSYSLHVLALEELKKDRARLIETLSALKLQIEKEGQNIEEKEIQNLQAELDRINLKMLESPQLGERLCENYFYVHGNILMKLGNYSQAHDQYLKFVHFRPEHQQVYLKLAALSLRENRGQEANDYISLAEYHGMKAEGQFRQMFPEISQKMKEEKMRPQRKGFYLLLRGGGNFSQGGDYGDVVEIREEYASGFRNFFNLRYIDATTSKAPFFKSFQGEVGYQYHRFGVGLEFGPIIHTYQEINTVYAYPGSWDFSFSVLPILLNLRLDLLESASLKATFISGGGFYRAKFISEMKNVVDNTTSSLDEYRQHTFGFHLGLSLEFSVIRPLSLILESRYRFAEFNNLRGTTKFWPDSDYESVYAGDLFLFRHKFYENAGFNEGFLYQDYLPEGKVDFNLNGWEMSLGIKFYF